MCGIFGFSGAKCNPNLIRLIAETAARRGPDAFGYAYFPMYYSEKPVVAKSPGRPKDFEKVSADLAGNRAFIGHARLATCGDGRDLNEAHPFVVNDVALVHNGTIPFARDLVARFSFEPATEVDSEVLALLASRGEEDADPWDRVYKAVEDCSGVPMAALLLIKGVLYVVRRGMPLFWQHYPESTYLCSTNPDESFVEVPDNTIHEFQAGAITKWSRIGGIHAPRQSW